MSHSHIEQQVQDVVEPIIEDLGLELVHVFYGNEQGRWILRLTIDGPDGIGHEECQKVSQAVDEPLDAADPIPGRYYLEVSSPGLDRPLVKEEHYLRFIGHDIRLRTKEPIDGRKNWSGRLENVVDDHVVLTLDTKEQVHLPMHMIRIARLIPEI